MIGGTKALLRAISSPWLSLIEHASDTSLCDAQVSLHALEGELDDEQIAKKYKLSRKDLASVPFRELTKAQSVEAGLNHGERMLSPSWLL